MTGRAQAGGRLAAPGIAGAGLSSNPDSLSSNPGALSSNLAGLTSNLPSLDDLLHDPWRQALLNELPGELAAHLGAIGRRHPLKGVKDLMVNPPAPFDEWVWVSRRALAVQGSGEDFRRNIVAAYIAMAMQMPDNGLQCVMFTHQDTSVWCDLFGISWVAGPNGGRSMRSKFDSRRQSTAVAPHKACT